MLEFKVLKLYRYWPD